MELLIFLLFLTGLFVWASSSSRNVETKENELEKRNLEWAQFIASYKKQAKTKQEKELIKRMLADIKNNGLPVDVEDLMEIDEIQADISVPLVSNTEKVTSQNNKSLHDLEYDYGNDSGNNDTNEEPTGIQSISESKSPDIDGPSLLLYFGAFLFITSAGLFVAFGQISGYLKTIIVLLIVASLYALGLWLYKNQPKFSQVGITFAGISLAIAPLVGLAAYSYIFNESSGDLVWFFTSLFCLALYLHALITLKKPLINYIFIFTFLSLFESGVSIIEAPIYYFGWGLALVGIITMLAAKLRFLDESFKEASSNTAVFFIPLSVLVSLAMIPSEGLLQLSVSLLLASVYYLLQYFVNIDDSNRYNYLSISHVSMLATAGTFAYSLNDSFKDLALALLLVNIIQFIVALVYKLKDNYKNSFLAILLSSSVLAIIFSWSYPGLLLTNLLVLIFVCLVLWFKYKEDSLYGLGYVAIPTVPFYIGYFMVEPSPSYTTVAFYLFVSMLVMQGFYLTTQKIINIDLENIAKYSIWIVGLFVTLLAFAGGDKTVTLALIYSTIFINLVFGIYLKSKDFAIASSVILLASSLTAIVLNIETPSIVTINIIAFILINFYIWIKYKDPSAFNLAFITIPLVPIYISYFLADPMLNSLQVAFNLILVLIILYSIYYFSNKHLNEQSLFLAKSTILIISFISIIIGFAGESTADIMLISYIVLLLSFIFGVLYKERDFILASGLIVSLPIFRFAEGGQALFYSSAIALTFNIYSALKYREELFRWLGSIIWFSFPVILNVAFNLGWGVNDFCVSYMVVSLGFILARSIARGAVFTSSKIPLISYDRNKSFSYVLGYIAALFFAIVFSLVSKDAQLLSSVTFSYVLIVIILLAKYIEKNQYLYSLIPVILQLLILTAIRPDKANGLLDVYAFASTISASALYFAASIADIKDDAKKWLMAVSLLSTYTVTFISLGGEYSWMAPFTLLIAGSITIYHFWNDGQEARELSGAIITASVVWILYYFGIRDLQAYTHVVAAQLALYAYLRYKLGQKEASQNYVMIALATATVPLIIQAISSESGGLYGWWLLLEQIGFMLIGLTIKNKMMTLWGLYVAIGAVLYQLRNLGWAALTLLAVVIIAIAVYKIANSNDRND